MRAILRVDSRYGSSTLREDYVLGADAPYVDVRVALDWHEQLKLLKLRYPTSVEAETRDVRDAVRPPRAAGERRRGARPGVGRRLRRRPRARPWSNDAKYGYDVRGGDIGISAVRSPVWAWHDPRELEEGGDFEYMDQGRQTFLVRLVPHAGDWRARGRRAARGRAEPAAVRADRDLPRRAAGRSARRSRATAAATSSSPS